MLECVCAVCLFVACRMMRVAKKLVCSIHTSSIDKVLLQIRKPLVNVDGFLDLLVLVEFRVFVEECLKFFVPVALLADGYCPY